MLANYINQGGKRNGSMAIIEPHHADIFDFINLRNQMAIHLQERGTFCIGYQIYL
jgi:ribonucleotide reductase alpha subunit